MSDGHDAIHRKYRALIDELYKTAPSEEADLEAILAFAADARRMIAELQNIILGRHDGDPQ